jgi:hypothetical protein
MAAGLLHGTEKCAKQVECIRPCISVGLFEKIQAIVKIAIIKHAYILTLAEPSSTGTRSRKVFVVNRLFSLFKNGNIWQFRNRA